MKNLFFLIIALLHFSISYGQTSFLKSLELYNLYYQNPSYIISDSKYQLDVVPHVLSTKGITSKFVLSAPKLNSGFGFGFQRFKYIEDTYNSFVVDYAYRYSFTEKLKICGGIRMDYSQMNFGNADYYSQAVKKIMQINTTIGARFQYSKLHCGVSVIVPLLYKMELFTSEDVTEIVKKPKPDNSYQFLCGYSLGKRNLKFDPLFSMQYMQDNTSWYLGANTMFFNVFGFGLTAGDLNSVSLTFKIPEVATFNLVLLSGEEYNTYSLSFSPLKILGQIKIAL